VVLDQLVHLVERAFVEQKIDALAGGELAFFVLAFAALGTSALFGGRVAAAELFQTIHQCSE
jgi:hypothetical protein